MRRYKNMLQKPNEIEALCSFLADKKIKTIIEIGVERGGTTILWANLVGKKGKVFAIDLYSVQPVYRGEKPKEITEIVGDSHSLGVVQVLQNHLGNERVDLLFIDGDHSYEGARADYEDYKPFVKSGGWIVFHDIVNQPVANLWQELKKQDVFSLEIIDQTHYDTDWEGWGGIGVLGA